MPDGRKYRPDAGVLTSVFFSYIMYTCSLYMEVMVKRRTGMMLPVWQGYRVQRFQELLTALNW